MVPELNEFRVSLTDALIYEEDVERGCKAEGTRYMPAQAEVYRKALERSSRISLGAGLCESLVDLFLSLDGSERYGGIQFSGVCQQLDAFLNSQGFQFEWDGLPNRTGVTWILMLPKEERLQAYEEFPELRLPTGRKL